MLIEERINQFLNRIPRLKKVIKRFYQLCLYTISPKIIAEGNFEVLSPDEKSEFFFGYYDKSPWDSSGRFVLCMKALETWKYPAPKDPVDIILIDTLCNRSKTIAKSNSWNVQQGCMLQWIGPSFENEIIFNDYREEELCSIKLDIKTGSEKIYKMPIYSVDNEGKFALTLDFLRLHQFRPGYGYSNRKCDTAEISIPEGPCIWKINLIDEIIKPILDYQDLISFETRPEMIGAIHKVNHIMISPNGKRFLFLHRWIKRGGKFSRLITCSNDGSDLYNLCDDNMVSHCTWKNNYEVIAFAHKKDYGFGYYLFKDKSQEHRRLWPELNSDGHPSCSSDGRIVTDTYPNRARVSSLIVIDDSKEEPKIEIVGRFFSPFRYDNLNRCDLHPRWSPDGKKVCIDSAHSGKRELYVVYV